MPAGCQESQPPATEGAQQPCMVDAGASEVEGGVEAWPADVHSESRGSGRGKSGLNGRRKRHVRENTQQYYSDGGVGCEPHSEVAIEENRAEKRQKMDDHSQQGLVHVPAEEQEAHTDSHHGNMDPPPDGEDMETTVRRLQSDVTDMLAKWGEAFSESERYEAFCPVRLDELLRAAHNLEQSLLQQKRSMKERLSALLGML